MKMSYPKRRGHAQITLSDKRIVIAGGYNGDEMKNDMMISSDGGKTFTHMQPTHPFTPRAQCCLLEYRRKLLIIGGCGDLISPSIFEANIDALHEWRPVLCTTQMPKLISPKCVVIKNSIFMVGCTPRADQHLPIILRSAEVGRSWIKIAPMTSFLCENIPITIHSLPNGSIVTICMNKGGYNTIFKSDSRNHARWDCVSRHCPFGPRDEFSCVQMSDTQHFVIMGGYWDLVYRPDVWSSYDTGKTWACVCMTPPWRPRWYCAGSAVDGRIVLSGGWHLADNLDDVWSSDDAGVKWVCESVSTASESFVYHTKYEKEQWSIDVVTVAYDERFETAVREGEESKAMHLARFVFSRHESASRILQKSHPTAIDPSFPVERIMELFDKIRDMSDLKDSIERLVCSSIKEWCAYVFEFGMDMQTLRFVLLVFCAHIDIRKKKNRSLLVKRFLATVVSAPLCFNNVLVQWWQSSCASQVPSILFCLQRLLDEYGSKTGHMQTILKFMSIIYAASNADCSNASISARVDATAELGAWKNWKESHVVEFSYLQFPFILTSESIMRILSAHWEEMRDSTDATIHVDLLRDESAFTALERAVEHCVPLDLAGGLKDGSVRFADEIGVDLGGPTRECISLALRDMLHPSFGIFDANDDGILYLRDDRLRSRFDFSRLRTAGIIFGLAFINSVFIRIPCSDTLWISLLCASPPLPCLSELRTRDSEMHHYLEQLLHDNTSTLEEQVCVSFPDDPDRLLSQANKSEYIQQLLIHKLRIPIQSSAAALHDGFKTVCSDELLSLFDWKILSRMMQVDTSVTIHSLESLTDYEYPYCRSHPVIQRFWSLLHSYTSSQISSFFLFLTGSESPSFLSTRITIKHVCDPSRFPSASTCFSRLYLPSYSSDDDMRHKFSIAIQWSRGFDLV